MIFFLCFLVYLKSEMQNVELNVIPNLVYEFILLSAKGQKEYILRGIFDHFQELEIQYDVTRDRQST